MLNKVIGGGIGGAIGRVIGGVGIAAMGGAVGIPAAAVTVIGVVGGALVGNQVGKMVEGIKSRRQVSWARSLSAFVQQCCQ